MSTRIYAEEVTPQAQQILDSRPKNIGVLLDARVEKTPHAVGWKYPDAHDVWQDLTWTQFRDQVHQFAAGLSTLGVEYEQRLAIIASTRLEWVIADLANNCLGGATTTVYPNTAAGDVEYIVEHSAAQIVVAENAEQAAKITSLEGLRDVVRHIIVMDGEAGDDPRLIAWADVVRRGEQALAENPKVVYDAMEKVGPDTLATLIYTSGTTGRPKGVELTHDSWIFEAASVKIWDILQESDVHYLWLPMAHVFGKDLVVIDIYHGTCTAIDGRIDKIISNLGIVKPSIMCAAPRIFEKVRAAVLTASPSGTLKGKIARGAFRTGRQALEYLYAGKPMPTFLTWRYKLANKLVFSKLQEKLGGNMRILVSGSAKLNPQVQSWFFMAGLTIVEGYGMTETTAIATLNHPDELRFNVVGKPIPGTQIKLGDDGEIMIKGPHITRRYHKDPERTEEVFNDGWLCTGDIGEFDAEGNLRITDRKKDLIKTSGGKYVSPQEVEATIVANCPYVAQAVVIGEGRKYVSALVVMDRDQLLKFGRKRNLGDDYATLSQLPEIKASVDRYIERANAHLEKWETVKRYAILPEEFSVDDDTVTPNMKVRRQSVIDRYSDIVEGLYEAEPDA